MLTRLLIGALAAFLLAWAVGWWVQGKDGISVTTENDLAEERVTTRELTPLEARLSRYGLSAFTGLLGLLVAWIAVRGPEDAEWAQRGAYAMVVLSLAAVGAWGSVWAWRGFRAKRIPDHGAPDYADTALSEGPAEALSQAFLSLLPRRFLLLLGTAGFMVLTVVLVRAAVGLMTGDTPLDAPQPTGWLVTASDYYELAAMMLFAALLLVGVVEGLLTGDLGLSGACVTLLALNAVGFGIAFLLGAVDGQVDAARSVLDLFA